MANRATGEIYRTTSIPGIRQTFGETVADAFGLVFHQASDKKLYRARANAAATVAGKLFICLDAATVADKVGNVLAQGIVEKTGWSWTVGGLVYISPGTAGGLTQTVPTGTQKIRPVGFATGTDQIDFRPMWGTGAKYEIDFADIPASQGDILVRSPTAWGAESNVPAHPVVPDLRNRILRILDGAGKELEIHQVWIPKFESAGFTQANLNGIECGGFWMDKYQACMGDASNVSRGSVSVNDPGLNGAASMPGVVVWTDINWSNAMKAIENREGDANVAVGTCTAATSKTKFYVENISHLIGRRVRVEQDGVTYIRRVVRAGGDADSDGNAAKLLELYPALPANITGNDTYEIVKHYLPGGYEWFSLGAWAMKYRYQYGLGYPKGNNDWGKDHEDARLAINEGLPDPVRPGYSGNAIARCLAGTGPVSWSLNGKESGIYDLNGNVWEWCDLLIGSTDNHTINPGYPGEGHVLPTSTGCVTELYDPALDGKHSLAAEIFAPKTVGTAKAEFGNDYYYQATGPRAAHRGGNRDNGASAGLFSLGVSYAPSHTYSSRGFRGVC